MKWGNHALIVNKHNMSNTNKYCTLLRHKKVCKDVALTVKGVSKVKEKHVKCSTAGNKFTEKT